MKEIKTTLQSIACGGTGGEITAVDTMDGKILRIRPFRNDTAYTKEELAPSMWKIDVDGKVFEPSIKTCPNWIALAYKNRVYSKNRVLKPLKRVDWEPGGAYRSSSRSAGMRRSTSSSPSCVASSTSTARIR